jgi:polyisoprenoid-binding protein YceI
MRQLLILVLGCGAHAALADECYAVDPARGSVKFELRQAGAPFRGAFRRFGGELCLTQERVTRIAVWLEPASVDTGLPEIDAALKDREFFDVRSHPRIAFTGAGERGVARGTLEIRDRRRDVGIPFQLAGHGAIRTVSGSLTIDRLAYDVGTGEWSDTRWLGAEVRVEFSAGLTRK